MSDAVCARQRVLYKMLATAWGSTPRVRIWRCPSYFISRAVWHSVTVRVKSLVSVRLRNTRVHFTVPALLTYMPASSHCELTARFYPRTSNESLKDSMRSPSSAPMGLVDDSPRTATHWRAPIKPSPWAVSFSLPHHWLRPLGH